MTAALEYRGAGSEIRNLSETDHTFELRIVSYGVVDSYGSVWEPGVFNESLTRRLPSACYAHDWARIIGSLKEYEEKSDGIDGLVQFADFDHVPDARMAWSLMKEGHLKDTSFGFKRQAWQDQRNDSKYAPTLTGEKERIRVARLDEVSPVLVGAVPGSRTLAVRSEERIPRQDAATMLAAVASGQLSLRDALNQLEGTQDEGHVRQDENTETRQVELSAEDLRDVSMLMQLDGVFLGDLDFLRAPDGTMKLKQFWANGEGALKIRWGTDGDHDRCVRHLSKYVGPGVVHGLCQNIEQLAKGK